MFSAGWDALPEPTQDIEGAKAMVEAAGATGKTIVLGTSNELAPVTTMANAVKAAAEDIGLKVELRPVSAANYINLFIDPERPRGHRRVHHDQLPGLRRPGRAATPRSWCPTARRTSTATRTTRSPPLIDEARTTADPAARATLVTQAQAVLQQELPWIGIANPDTVLVTNADLTGAPASFAYMFSPWPAGLGGTN